MLRVELFVLLGAVPAFILGILSTLWFQRVLRWRDAQIKRTLVKVRVEESLEEAETIQLLEELSQRDDLSFVSSQKNRHLS